MYHKVDKRRSSDITFKQVKVLWPVPGAYAENSTLYLYRCSCNSETDDMTQGGKTGHVPGCSLWHIADSMGANLKGATAAWVGDTETGEYRGIYVTYGTFYANDSTIYHPVIAVKETFIDVNFADCVSIAISQCDDVQTYSQGQLKSLNATYKRSAGYTESYAETDVILRAKRVNGVLYISLASVLNRWYAATLRKI